MHHLKPEWQTPPGGDFASYVEQLNADAALHEAIERRRQAARQRPAQGMAQRPMQKKPALPSPRPATHSAPRTATRPTPRPVPAADSPAQTSAFVGKVILGVIAAFIALMLFAEDSDSGMDIFGFLIIAFIAWRVFAGGKRNK